MWLATLQQPFNIAEISLEDPCPNETSATNEITYQIVCQRKSAKLIDDLGFTYNVKSKRSYATYWNEITYQIVEDDGQRKSAKLINGLGFTYNVKSKRSFATYWQCTVRPKGNHAMQSFRYQERDGKFSAGSSAHNHVAKPGALLANVILKEVKEKALADKFQPCSICHCWGGNMLKLSEGVCSLVRYNWFLWEDLI